MHEHENFVDIHCHILPSVDDGPTSWDESLAMARIAVADGTRTMVATPHQLGGYECNRGDMIRSRVQQMQARLDQRGIPLEVLPGADVRIMPEMLAGLRSGNVLTIGDTGVYVLLELPHDVYFPVEPVLESLAREGMHGILSHPERNRGLLQDPQLAAHLVQRGCAMQVTAGSLVGAFGPTCQEMSEWIFEHGLAHLVASDGHGSRVRRPMMARAFERISRLVDKTTAVQTCCTNPLQIARGEPMDLQMAKPACRGFASWFGWKRAG